MKQRFKSIYFPDLASEDSAKQSLTLAFGEPDRELFDRVNPLTSHEARQALGYATHRSLVGAAKRARQPVNAFCLARLRSRVPDAARAADTAAPAFGIAAIQSTFRGGGAEPMHNWYPYLEGYSPAFVEEILRCHAPGAGRVLDPFGGVGTTPLTAARLGYESYYCELNPLLQRLVETKTIALNLAANERRRLATELVELADESPRWYVRAEPCELLRAAHATAFGDSEFFVPAVFDAVLRLRAALDRMACEAPLRARFAELAACASLIPVSRLIRRGDLRFKTAEEAAKGERQLEVEVAGSLRGIAADLAALTGVPTSPVLACENARQLALLPPLETDIVITSPPYLNGTNYFRNTKVELWFLRALRTEADMRAFRFKTVTAGINDVTVGRQAEAATPEIAALVRRLERESYDRRIAQMIAGYFADMSEVFDGLQRHVRRDAPVILDIGDSCYGGIHVPTDRLLAGLLEARGFELEQTVPLRARSSRSGSPLHQVLLICRHRPAPDWTTAEAAPASALDWAPAWRQFKRELPHQTGQFAKRNWGHGLHSLCSYQGKMKPALAHFLIDTFVPPGGRVLDPFAGVGTIPFEAAQRGMDATAFDISPAALAICRAKLTRPTPADCERVLTRLASSLAGGRPTEREQASAAAITFNGPLPSYFAPATLREILLARRFFLAQPATTSAESLVLASLLHILHGNRPYALSRRSHPITPFAPTGPAEYRALLPRLKDKVERSLACELTPDFRPGTTWYQDATAWWPHEVDQLDAIVTSPPFFDSTRFHLANWMRLWFTGWEAEDFRTRPLAFVDERQKKSLAIYERVFGQSRERLKPGGVLVLHLGKSRKCDMGAELARLARRWFRVADLFDESVAHCESHGIADKGTVTSHQFLVLT